MTMHSKGRFQVPQLQGENLKLRDETWRRQSLDTHPGCLILMIPKTLHRRKHRAMLLPFPFCRWDRRPGKPQIPRRGEGMAVADLPMITGITAEKVIPFPWPSDVSCVSNYPFECKTPLPLSHHFTFFGLYFEASV